MSGTPSPQIPASEAGRDCAALTVYFDGSCPLCALEIDHYGRQEGAERLLFVDISALEADAGPGLSCASAMARLHARLPDGRLISGARAFVAIWDQLPGWRWAATLTGIPGAIFVLEGAYRVFLPVRPLLSRSARMFLSGAGSRGAASGGKAGKAPSSTTVGP